MQRIFANIAGGLIAGVVYYLFTEKLIESIFVAVFVLIIAFLLDFFKTRKKIRQNH